MQKNKEKFIYEYCKLCEKYNLMISLDALEPYNEIELQNNVDKIRHYEEYWENLEKCFRSW